MYSVSCLQICLSNRFTKIFDEIEWAVSNQDVILQDSETRTWTVRCHAGWWNTVDSCLHLGLSGNTEGYWLLLLWMLCVIHSKVLFALIVSVKRSTLSWVQQCQTFSSNPRNSWLAAEESINCNHALVIHRPAFQSLFTNNVLIQVAEMEKQWQHIDKMAI